MMPEPSAVDYSKAFELDPRPASKHPNRMLDTFERFHAPLVSSLRILLVIVIAMVVHVVVLRGFDAIKTRIANHEREGAARLQTLSRVVRYLVGVGLFVIATSLTLAELGISIAPILATAGVAGVAIGFGAQAIVRDYLNGFFLLLEDQIRQGEVVNIAGQGGVVEAVTLRYVQLRNVEGRLIFIPNGEIKIVENLTRGFAQPLIEVGIDYAADIDRALTVLKTTLLMARQDAVLGPLIVEEPEVMGVESLGASSVVLRARVKVVPPSEQWKVRRALLARVKRAFDEAGIIIPFNQLTLHLPSKLSLPKDANDETDESLRDG